MTKASSNPSQPTTEELGELLYEYAEEVGPGHMLSYGDIALFFLEEWNNELLDRWARRKGFQDWADYNDSERDCIVCGLTVTTENGEEVGCGWVHSNYCVMTHLATCDDCFETYLDVDELTDALAGMVREDGS